MSKDLVAMVKADLEQRGVNLTGPCGAFAITSRVAWTLRGEGYGLIHKSAGQNGCDAPGGRYAIDAVMLEDGQTFDLLVNGGGDEDKEGRPIPGTGNGPAWQIVRGQPPGAWRPPFNPDAGAVEPGEPVLPPPGPDGEVHYLAAMAMALAAMAAHLADLKEQLTLYRAELLTSREDITKAQDAIRSRLLEIQLKQNKRLTGIGRGSILGTSVIELTPEK